MGLLHSRSRSQQRSKCQWMFVQMISSESRNIFYQTWYGDSPSWVNVVCWLLFSVRSTLMLPQSHVKDPGHSAKSAGGRLHLNMHIYLWPNKVRVGWLCHHSGIVWEPTQKQAHTQLIREHPVIVISAQWAIVDWSWPKEWNQCARANLHFKKKKENSLGKWNCQTFSQNHRTRGKSHYHSISPCPRLFFH